MVRLLPSEPHLASFPPSNPPSPSIPPSLSPYLHTILYQSKLRYSEMWILMLFNDMRMIPKRCQKNLNAFWKVKFAEYGWLPDAWEVLHLDYNIWLRNMIVVNQRISEWTSVEWTCMCGNKPAGATFSQQPVGTPLDLCLSTWIARPSPLNLFCAKMVPGSCTPPAPCYRFHFVALQKMKNEKKSPKFTNIPSKFEAGFKLQSEMVDLMICFSKFM